MRVYNYKKRYFPYIVGIITGIIGTILCETISYKIGIRFSLIYAIIPLSVDFGFTKTRGLKTENYIHYITLTGMILLFLSMLLTNDLQVKSFIFNILFLYFGIKHCENRI